MRRNLKKLGCAILCICLLLVNTPGSISYAENTEQYATYTDADADTTTEDVDMPVVEETTQTATDTDAEDIYTEAATAEDTDDIYASSVTAGDVLLSATAMVEDALLYAASPELPEGGYSLEINSQADWDNLAAGNSSGWTFSGGAAVYTEDKNPVVIILNTDITLSADITLTVPTINSVSKDFLLYGNGHSIDINGHAFRVQGANTVTIEQTHIKNGTVQVYGHMIFRSTDSQFSASSVELYTNDATETTNITGCKFFDCPDPCINSMAAPCSFRFSDCYMNNCGLLFKTANTASNTKVNFSGITAENCTGTVLGYSTTITASATYYIIESISGCNLSTSTPGITAIEHNVGSIGEITGCTITGFDTGIKLSGCDSSSVSDIDTITISGNTITDCITGVDIERLNGYENAMISDLTMTAREGVSGTVGYKGNYGLTSNNFNYDFEQMPQIKSCQISGFDTGINLSNCPIVISDCEINDCNYGVNLSSSQAAIVDTTLRARLQMKIPAMVKNGVTSNAMCFLIDCDIYDFDIGSDMTSSSNTAIIGCKFQSKKTNLNSYATSVYDTRFIGGETAVTIRSGSSYFYDCVIEGDATTQSGFAYAQGITASLYIFNLERAYYNPPFVYYDYVYQYSDRTVNNGKSEISNCTTGINASGSLFIGDTHIHDCKTGIQAYITNFYGNNLIEGCTDGVNTDNLARFNYGDDSNNTFTDIKVDTIRNCSNNGLSSTVTMSSGMTADWNHRLEIYDCGNYGIEVKNTIQDIVVDIHDCKTGVYTTSDATGTTQFSGTSKIYDNREWNIYDASTSNTSRFVLLGTEGTLTGGGIGNVYTNHNMGMAIIYPQNLYSDDSVYYLGTTTSMYILNVGNLYGTVVFDTIDSGYTLGRRVALISNPNHTSQMFAKKEGFIISTEMDGNTPYAVFAAGCDVTYDVTTNGGDTFDDEKLSDEEIENGKLPRISYLVGENIDLTYTASKTGYEFVGWNTDKDATEGLEPDTLTAERKDITLYAIYKKTAYINYHTYDTALDYRTAVTIYNNQDIECELDTYTAGGNKTFVGYVLDEDAVVSSADDLLAEGATVTGSPNGLDVYCVYEKQGQLDYLKKDGTILSTERITVYDIASENKKFVYIIRAGEPVAGFTFTGWKDEAGNSFVAGNTLRTEENHIVLTPVYVEGEEPTPETPSPETPTPNTPDTDIPSAEPPMIQPPTTETKAQTG